MRNVYPQLRKRIARHQPSRDDVRSVVARWQSNLHTEEVVREASALLARAFTDLPRDDPDAVPVEALRALAEDVDPQLARPEDALSVLRFLDAQPPELEGAWQEWRRYWDGVDYAARLRELELASSRGGEVASADALVHLITQCHSFEPVLAEFHAAWGGRRRLWRDELAEFGRYIVELVEVGETSELPGVFATAERLLLEGTKATQDLVGSAFLSAMQRGAEANPAATAQLEGFMGAVTRAVWDGLRRLRAAESSRLATSSARTGRG